MPVNPFPLSLLLFPLVLIQCRPVEKETPGPSAFSPSISIDTTGEWSGDYTRDSLRLIELYGQYGTADQSMKYDSSIQICQEIIKVGAPLMEVRFDSSLFEKYADAYRGIGWALTNLGQFDEGIRYLELCMKQLKEGFDEKQIRATETCVAIAYNYMWRGDFDHALEYVNKSIHISNQIFKENHRYFGNNYQLGYVYFHKGEQEKAIEYYWKSIRFKRRFDKNGQSWINPMVLLINSYLEIHAPEDAEKALNDASEWMKTSFAANDKDKRFYLEYSKARVHLARGRLKEAKNAAQNFINSFLVKGIVNEDMPILGDGYFILGQVQLKNGQPGPAVQSLKKAVEAWDAHYGFGSTFSIKALLKIADIKRTQKEFLSALDFLQLAIDRTIPGMKKQSVFEFPDLENMTASENLLAILTQKALTLRETYMVQKEQKYLLAAWETTQKTIDYLQKSREGFHWQDSKITLSQKSIPVVETGMDCAKELFDITGDVRFIEEAYLSLEKVKGIVLLENLNTSFARVSSNLTRELLDKEEKIVRELGLYDRLVLEERQKGEDQDSVRLYYLLDKRLAVKESYDSLAEVLKKENPEFYHLKNDLPVSSIPDVQKHLKKGEVLANYFLGDSSLFLFSVSNNQFFFHQIPWTDSLEAGIERFTRFASKSPDAWDSETTRDWAETGYDLFKTLLPDWSRFPTPSSLIVIPDGRLDYLPFHLLLTEEPGDRDFRHLPYLLQTCPVRYQFSSSLLIHPFKPLKKSKIRYAGFAPEYQGRELVASRSAEDSARIAELYPELVRSGLSELAFNKPEVEESASLWNGSAYLGPSATEQNFKETGPEAEILHLAMHALTNDEEPLLSQLVFSSEENPAEDGKLHNYELQNLSLSADLTVLSACNTGSGKLRRGEGVMSVSRAFRLAGCPNIVMSLWQANDRSTGEIVTRFFRGLKKGHGKAEALQESSLYFLENADERYTHPFYWGNLMLIGDNEPVRGGGLWWVYGVGLLGFWVIGLLGYWVWVVRPFSNFTAASL